VVFTFFRKKDQDDGKSDRAQSPKQDKAGSPVAKPADKPKPASAQPVPSVPKKTSVAGDLSGNTDVEVVDSTSELSATAEEAAMLYASNQIDLALDVLLNTVKAGSPDLEVWLMLFDLYQQKGMQQEFEELALSFVVRFERSPPAWREIKTASQSLAQQDGTFALSGQLSGASKPQFDEMARIAENTGQLRLDFGKIENVAAAGGVLLLQALRNIRKSGHRIAITSLDQFVKIVQSATGSVLEREQKMLFLLLLELYQIKGMQAEFEDMALQYAMKFEVSPPSWEPLTQGQALAGSEPEPLPAEPEASRKSYALRGEVAGSADPQLQGIIGHATKRQEVNIDMSDLRRMDFVSCGMFLNILAGLQKAGKNVSITGANDLILALCRVMGVHKVATLVRNK
jgi:ABC-type transporter Mla MlaB component